MRRMAFYCGLALALTAGVRPASASDTQIGNVIQQTFNGAVGLRDGRANTEQLFYAHDIFSDERVQTGPDANTRLRFLDDTELSVGVSSDVRLDRFVYDPNQGAGEALITFSTGVFRFVTGKIRTKEAVTLRVPTATIAIRGTNLVISVHEDGSAEIAVIEGAIRVQPQGNLAAQDVSAGSTVLIAESSGATTVRDGVDVPDGLTAPRGDRLNHHDSDRAPRGRRPRPR
jgi:hypothetical protein